MSDHLSGIGSLIGRIIGRTTDCDMDCSLAEFGISEYLLLIVVFAVAFVITRRLVSSRHRSP